MSENLEAAPQVSSSAQSSAEQLNAGAILKSAREAAGLHIAVLAVSLKVPVKKLEALEENRFDLLPDTVFVRALASSVCRTLKIDPEPVLQQLPNTAAPRLRTDEVGINVPFRVPGTLQGLLSRDQLARPLVLAVLALLVGALALVFVPSMQVEEVAQVLRFDTSALNSPDVSASPAPMEAQSPAPTELGGASLAAPVAAPTPLPQAGATTEPKAEPALAPSVDLIIFEARGVSWLEVIDASGAVQVRKTMSEGETVRVSGALPLSVVIGRVDNMVVKVRDKPFDLASVAKNNVARFEVK